MRSLRVYTTEAVILKRKPTGETDKLITVFSRRYGKIRLLAKGIRRINSRRSGHLELFSISTLTVHGGHSMDIITEAQVIQNGNSFDEDNASLPYMYCICELVDQLLPDNQEHQDIYELLRSALLGLHIRNTSAQFQDIFIDFTHQLLWTLGYLPKTKRLEDSHIQVFVERITERRLRTWPLLKEMKS